MVITLGNESAVESNPERGRESEIAVREITATGINESEITETETIVKGTIERETTAESERETTSPVARSADLPAALRTAHTPPDPLKNLLSNLQPTEAAKSLCLTRCGTLLQTEYTPNRG